MRSLAFLVHCVYLGNLMDDGHGMPQRVNHPPQGRSPDNPMSGNFRKQQFGPQQGMGGGFNPQGRPQGRGPGSPDNPMSGDFRQQQFGQQQGVGGGFNPQGRPQGRDPGSPDNSMSGDFRQQQFGPQQGMGGNPPFNPQGREGFQRGTRPPYRPAFRQYHPPGPFGSPVQFPPGYPQGNFGPPPPYGPPPPPPFMPGPQFNPNEGESGGEVMGDGGEEGEPMGDGEIFQEENPMEEGDFASDEIPIENGNEGDEGETEERHMSGRSVPAARRSRDRKPRTSLTS